MSQNILNGMPWWVKGLGAVGFPAAVAIFLLMQSAGWIPSTLQSSATTLERLMKSADAHEQTTRDLVERLTTALRVMCENDARDASERNRCQHIR